MKTSFRPHYAMAKPARRQLPPRFEQKGAMPTNPAFLTRAIFASKKSNPSQFQLSLVCEKPPYVRLQVVPHTPKYINPN